MRRIPSVKSLMTPFPYTIEADRPLEEAARMMEEQDIRHLPVSRDGELVGIVSERDVRWAMELASESESGRPVLVDQICDHGAQRVDLSERLDNVLIRMAREHATVILVVKQGRLAGVFTSTDACRGFAEHLRAEFSPGGGDRAA